MDREDEMWLNGFDVAMATVRKYMGRWWDDGLRERELADALAGIEYDARLRRNNYESGATHGDSKSVYTVADGQLVAETQTEDVAIAYIADSTLNTRRMAFYGRPGFEPGEPFPRPEPSQIIAQSHYEGTDEKCKDVRFWNQKLREMADAIALLPAHHGWQLLPGTKVKNGRVGEFYVASAQVPSWAINPRLQRYNHRAVQRPVSAVASVFMAVCESIEVGDIPVDNPLDTSKQCTPAHLIALCDLFHSPLCAKVRAEAGLRFNSKRDCLVAMLVWLRDEFAGGTRHFRLWEETFVSLCAGPNEKPWSRAEAQEAWQGAINRPPEGRSMVELPFYAPLSDERAVTMLEYVWLEACLRREQAVAP